MALAITPLLGRAHGLPDRDTPGSERFASHRNVPGEHPIWMTGMRFPIDLIWLDHDSQSHSRA